MLKKIDFFFENHQKPFNKPVIIKRLEIGGLFSIFFILCATVTICGSFLTFYLDNITEIKSLVPVITLDNTITANNLQVTTMFYIYGGTCTENSECISKINILESGISYTSKTKKCYFDGRNCKVVVSYLNVSLDSLSYILIKMDETSSFASAMSVNISCSSSIPDEISSVYIPLQPESGYYIFRGLIPSTISYEFTPSVRTI